METSLEQRVGQRIALFRMKSGLTKARLCLMAGISRPYLDQIESGTANITLRVLERLAQSLDVDVVALVQADSDEATRNPSDAASHR